jgi:hypothetical protein
VHRPLRHHLICDVEKFNIASNDPAPAHHCHQVGDEFVLRYVLEGSVRTRAASCLWEIVVVEMLNSAEQSGLKFLRQYYKQEPLDLDNDRFVRLHEWFLRELSQVDNLAKLSPDERATYQDLCSRCQKRYLVIKESPAYKLLLTIGRDAGPPFGENLRGFGRTVYDRVRDLKKLVDFSNCKSIVMVGNGAFPATLLWLHDNFPKLDYVGLDIDPGCVKMATELLTALGINNVDFELVDGGQYDFDGTDFVYIANHVVSKRTVLEQIARSTSVRQVVVREPTPRGELLSELVRPDVPPVFVADAAGTASVLSYDLLLRRVQYS